ATDWGGRRSGRRLASGRVAALAGLVTALAIVVFLPSAGAVHDTGVFQLDTTGTGLPAGVGGNAFANSPASTPAHAWAPVGLPLDGNGNSQGTGGGGAVRHIFRTDCNDGVTGFDGPCGGPGHDDTFSGGTKEDDDISAWHWADNTTANDKNDIEHAFT